MDPTFSQFCLQVGATGVQLLALMSNAQFPVATETGVYSWSSDPIDRFASSWAQALANGWRSRPRSCRRPTLPLWRQLFPGRIVGRGRSTRCSTISREFEARLTCSQRLTGSRGLVLPTHRRVDAARGSV